MYFKSNYNVNLMYDFLAGKEARKNGAAAFNIRAAEVYRKMGEDDHKILKESIPEETEITLSIKAVKREGAKLFDKIGLQVSS